MSAPPRIAVLAADELAAMLDAAAEAGARKALAVERDKDRMLSAAEAAKRARRRQADVLAALKSGELPGTFKAGGYGGRGCWKVTAAAVDAWAKGGG